MSIARIEWGQILAMEDDIRHLVRLADVLTTIGCGGESLSAGGSYVLGCHLHEIGDRLEKRFDAITPIKDGGPR